MGHCDKRAVFGFAALVIAMLGFALLVAVPAVAGDDPKACAPNDPNGLITSNLGV